MVGDALPVDSPLLSVEYRQFTNTGTWFTAVLCTVVHKAKGRGLSPPGCAYALVLQFCKYRSTTVLMFEFREMIESP